MSEPNRKAHNAPNRAASSAVAAVVLLAACRAAAQEALPVSANPIDQPWLAPSGTAAGMRTAPPGAIALQAYQRQYQEALSDKLYGEAAVAAKRMVDLLIEAGDGGQRAQALSKLAFAQRHGELYEAALQNYAAAIELLQSSENRLSESLIGPLGGLADTYMESGRADLALPVYEHALHLRHVNDGPHTLEQVELLEDLVTARLQSGDAGAALETVDRMIQLYARHFAIDSVEVLPPLQRKASLLSTLELHHEERAVYRDILHIIRDRRGAYDLSLLQPYSAIARTYFYDLDEVYFRSQPTTETGETWLQRALEVTERNPGATWEMQERALLELGDYYTVRDVQDLARVHYGRAWELLSANESRFDERRRALGEPVILLRSALDPYANFGYGSANGEADPEDYMDGYVVVSFTVTDLGRVSDVEVAKADPPGFQAMEERVIYGVRDFIFRPRYDDGRPVYARDQRYRHDYRYLESDLEAAN